MGDRVVVNPQGVPSGIIVCGGAHGGMREYLLVEDAAPGKNVASTNRRRAGKPWPRRSEVRATAPGLIR
ncbi:hypothetical protein ACFPH6_10235 [Streptomyces xiangluensis]|uniref:Uncharacterized protein n=1 Tax=Streptomyces xiangluensis TaxID=2665720 RepID=A0ABV8YHZ0_9ACTN